MSDIPVIQASDYPSALHFTNMIRHGTVMGTIKLPVEVQCGHLTFTITEQNFQTLSLGVLMGALWKELE